MENKKWYTNEDLTNGKYAHLFPVFEQQTLQTLRSKRLIKYTRAGKNVIYKKEWIDDYLNSNTVEVAS